MTRRKSGPKQRRRPNASARQRPAAKSTTERKLNQSSAARPPPGNGNFFPIVGIGASAGGLEAFGQMLEHLKPDTGMGFVYVQHLDRHHDSMLTALLAKSSGMPVHEARDGMPVQPNHIYVISPDTSLGISAGKLTVSARGSGTEPHMSIDRFLSALALDRGNRAIGVILSGTASDGTVGIQAIKQEDGLTFAQAPASAKYDGMPRSAIASGCVDFVQTPEQIAKELCHIVRHPYLRAPVRRDTGLLEDSHDELTAIFRALRAATGVDFNHYKTTTIKRRIVRRMVLNKIDRIADYARLIEHTPPEVEALYQDLLINVTSFFRDPGIGETLAATVLPRMLERRDPEQPLRVWVPGCASGEEVYSLAMTILEVLGEQRTPLQIFGTDISDTALDKARAGTYPASQLGDVSRERLRRFFVKLDGGYRIRKDVRDACLFARQDLSRDPPFSRLDIISCRNVLIYMDTALQQRIIPTFHYALNPGGVLVLGSSETIGTHADLFGLLDKRNKIYQKKSSALPGGHRSLVNFGAPPALGGRHAPLARHTGAGFPAADPKREADRIVLAKYAPASVLINENLDILQFRGRTGEYLEPSAGAASLNLLKMAREGLIAELRRAIQNARRRDAAVHSNTVPISNDGRSRMVSIEVTPFNQPDSKERYFLVTFESRTPNGRAARAPAKPPKATANAQRLEQELAATKEYLQSTIEAHEATNEELRSVLEEIQSSNEELQTLNEELETAKEELQSTNEELTTVNEELQNRNTELNVLNNDLTNLLNSVHLPVVMLNNNLRIRRFTPAAEKIFGLIPTDVGRPVSDLRLNQLVPKLDELIHEVMTSLRATEVEVEDGRWYSLRIRPYKTLDNKIEGAVLTFVDIHDMRHSLMQAEEARDYAQAIVEFVREPLLVVGANLRVHSASPAYYRLFRAVPADTEESMLFELESGRWDLPPLRQLMQRLLSGQEKTGTIEINGEFPRLGQARLLIRATATQKSFILLAFDELTKTAQPAQPTGALNESGT